MNLGISAGSHSADDAGSPSVFSTGSESERCGEVVRIPAEIGPPPLGSVLGRPVRRVGTRIEVTSEGRCIRITIFRVFLQATEHNSLQIRRNAGLNLRKWSDRVPGMGDHHFHGGLAQ